MKRKIIVVGGGPAGLMAAVKAGEQGADVLLLEKMKKPGRKMMITGKGRCNVTNTAELPEIIQNIPGNGKFLHSSLRAFDNHAVMEFFEEHGVNLKVERGNRVFPESDRAGDILSALLDALYRQGGRLECDAKVANIIVEEGRAVGVKLEGGAELRADAIILAVGGASYPGTGSTGDGYAMARNLGHTVTRILPALVPLETEESWVRDAQGLSLRNVRVRLLIEGKAACDLFGEMMFTHFGVTGPVILSLSRTASIALSEGKFVELQLNLKPALTQEQLSHRIDRDFEKYTKKQAKNAMVDLLPGKMIAPVLDAAFIDAEKMATQISQAERRRLAEALHGLSLVVTGTRSMAEAIVTAGGVSIKEIQPKTMESKLVKNLYFAGELLDIDAFTGGYNLQAAFSMGAAAGCWSVWNLEE